MKCRSEWHSPATAVRIRTSPGPGFCRLTSSMAGGLSTSCRTAPSAYAFFKIVTEYKYPESVRLRCCQPFANLRHGNRVFAEQMAGDGAFGRTIGQLERIGR